MRIKVKGLKMYGSCVKVVVRFCDLQKVIQ